jgi:hypothetical protein
MISPDVVLPLLVWWSKWIAAARVDERCVLLLHERALSDEQMLSQLLRLFASQYVMMHSSVWLDALLSSHQHAF